MNQPIRLSPSGPVIANAAGGPFAPGPGARVRLVEATTTIAGTSGVLLIPSTPTEIANPPGTTNFRVQLPDPNSALEYRATIICDVLNPTTNANASVELYIDTSSDAGSTWHEQVSNSHLVGFSGARQIRCDMPLRPGANVNAVSGAPAVLVRARIGASSGGGVVMIESAGTPGQVDGVGTCLLQLEECL